MKVSAIVAAGGSGSRLGTPGGKQLLELAGRPVLIHAFEKIIPLVDETIIVIVEHDILRLKELLAKFHMSEKIKVIVPSGDTRALSVHNGFQHVAHDTDLVLIHDGARPLITPEEIRSVINAGHEYGAAVLCTKVKDTIKQAVSGFVDATPSRETLWAAQTPQVIKKLWLAEAYERLPEWSDVTDDVGLVEMLGKKVRIVEGRYENIKITTKEDLLIAEMILKSAD